MLTKEEFNEVFNIYGLSKDEYIGIRPIKSGHINNTYTLYFDKGNRVKRYLLQEININVFKNPEELMANIEKVTVFCHDKLKSKKVVNYKNKFLRIFKTKDGKAYFVSSRNHYYRLFHFVENAVTFQTAEDDKMFENAGYTIGTFLNLLSDFPADQLNETILNFHNTAIRYQTFLESLKADKLNRAATCKEEINFVLEHKDITHQITDLLETKQMPIRVIHNDTKLNNIMFDFNNHDGLCLIDLDTIMPGSIVYDFGDAVRSGCNLGAEDEKDLSKVIFDVNLFRSFSQGFLNAVKESITDVELHNLTMGAIIMTFECGMRFLTDYLDGDTYFKTQYEDHNLIRCRSQFHLVKQMLEKKDELDKIILECRENSLKSN